MSTLTARDLLTLSPLLLIFFFSLASIKKKKKEKKEGRKEGWKEGRKEGRRVRREEKGI